MTKPTHRLQFFSGLEALGNEDGAHGYDGSMSVEAFDPADLPALAKRMDCIVGPCVCIVTAEDGNPRAYPFNHDPHA